MLVWILGKVAHGHRHELKVFINTLIADRELYGELSGLRTLRPRGAGPPLEDMIMGTDSGPAVVRS